MQIDDASVNVDISLLSPLCYIEICDLCDQVGDRKSAALPDKMLPRAVKGPPAKLVKVTAVVRLCIVHHSAVKYFDSA